MIEEIYKRRSTRHFLQKPIAQEDLDEILTAATWAPSEKNEQPWKFIIIRGEERKAMVKCLKKGIMRNRKGDETAISARDMTNSFLLPSIQHASWSRHRSLYS